MRIAFPSREFEAAVAAVCHGLASDEQMRALNELLRSDPRARDEYILFVEVHSRLASEPSLFADSGAAASTVPIAHGDAIANDVPGEFQPRTFARMRGWVVALAACFAVLAVIGFALWRKQSSPQETTSNAIAILADTVDAQWYQGSVAHPVGAALEPGWLRLKSGLAQVVFYSGARLVIEGPAEFRLISAHEAYCSNGLTSAEVPPQARGFRIGAPRMSVVDLGTEFGLDVKNSGAELHVFKGEVEFQVETAPKRGLLAGEAVSVDGSGGVRNIPANRSLFAKALDLQQKSVAMQDVRYRQWRAATSRLNIDPSLLVHFEFENTSPSEWMLHNAAGQNAAVPDGTIVGCQWAEGRWPGKHALEFRSISDRVRVTVPGEFESLTFSAWVNVEGLDRQFNSLFMADGFSPGKIHWQIRNGGALDLGIQGPTIEECQIFASPPVVGFDQFGRWMHLAVVIDSNRKRVTHYANGAVVSRHELKLEPPFFIGDAELGNWNPGRAPKTAPYFIRHFSGVMDEFALFTRALTDEEIDRLYLEGSPQTGPATSRNKSGRGRTGEIARSTAP